MIASLPIEIVRQIITFSLPQFEQSICAQRYNHLLNCMRVCSVWKVLAEEELYEHIVVPESNSLDLLAIQFNEREILGLRTKSLYLEVDTRLDIDKLFYIVNRCKASEDLWLVNFFAVEVFQAGGVDFSSLVRLKSLSLMGLTTILEDENTSIYVQLNSFLSLKHMTIVNCEFPEAPHFLSQLLTHTMLPQVTSFTFIQTNSEDRASSLPDCDSKFFNQLKIFVLYDSCAATEAVFTDSEVNMPSLETLMIHDVNILNHDFPSFSNLARLFIFNELEGFKSDFEWLEDWLGRNRHCHKIKTVYFPPYPDPLLELLPLKSAALEGINFILSKIDCQKLAATELLKILHEE